VQRPCGVCEIMEKIDELELKLWRDKEVVQICELEIGEIIGEENGLGSSDDLKNYQEGREVEILVCHVGNRLRSLRDLMDCQEDSEQILHCQLGNERRSLWHLEDFQEGSKSISDCQEGRDEHSRLSESLMDLEKSSIQQGLLMKMGSIDLMVCQESSGSIPYCQVGRDEQGNFDQPKEMTEHMRLSKGLINSEIELDQHVQLTEEEELRDILTTGGIGVFLPFSQEEAEVFVADDTAIAEEQSADIVKEELEKTLEAAQGDEEENEHSEECLNAFSQEAERDVALELTTEEAEEDDEHSKEWLNIFSQEAEETATWEFAAKEEKGVDNICFADLWEQIETLEERVKVQGVHIQHLKLETDERGMGDHNDLLTCQKFLQLRRLQKKSQPWEQLDAVIKEMMELTI
jgi:hypothetical protein